MTDYTVQLTPEHERALDHMRSANNGGLTREQFVQFFIARALENHALEIKDTFVEQTLALSDEDFAALAPKREARKAEIEAEQARLKAEEEAAAQRRAEEEARRAAEAAKIAEAAKEVPNDKDPVQPAPPG